MEELVFGGAKTNLPTAVVQKYIAIHMCPGGDLATFLVVEAAGGWRTYFVAGPWGAKTAQQNLFGQSRYVYESGDISRIDNFFVHGQIDPNDASKATPRALVHTEHVHQWKWHRPLAIKALASV